MVTHPVQSPAPPVPVAPPVPDGDPVAVVTPGPVDDGAPPLEEPVLPPAPPQAAAARAPQAKIKREENRPETLPKFMTRHGPVTNLHLQVQGMLARWGTL